MAHHPPGTVFDIPALASTYKITARDGDWYILETVSGMEKDAIHVGTALEHGSNFRLDVAA